jgi:outer membrane lipoprotein-sorting protein
MTQALSGNRRSDIAYQTALRHNRHQMTPDTGMPMTPRIMTRLLCLTFAVFTASAALAQQLTLPQVSDYLNQLQTVQGRFVQTNPDGSQIGGQIYIKRPGRIRFEYDPPEQSLVMAGGGQLAIFDPRSNAGPDRFPLNQTPLQVILQRNVDLGAARMVTDSQQSGALTLITIQDPDGRASGQMQLVFGAAPIGLRGWIITDDLGNETRIALTEMRIGGQINDILFNISAEMRRRGFDG